MTRDYPGEPSESGPCFPDSPHGTLRGWSLGCRCMLEQYRMIRQTLDLRMVSVAGDAVADAGVLSVVRGDPAEARRTLEAAEEAQLRAVADRLGQFRQLQLPVPQMPPDVRKRAVELGIELPGQEEVAP